MKTFLAFLASFIGASVVSSIALGGSPWLAALAAVVFGGFLSRYREAGPVALLTVSSVGALVFWAHAYLPAAVAFVLISVMVGLRHDGEGVEL